MKRMLLLAVVVWNVTALCAPQPEEKEEKSKVSAIQSPKIIRRLLYYATTRLRAKESPRYPLVPYIPRDY